MDSILGRYVTKDKQGTGLLRQRPLALGRTSRLLGMGLGSYMMARKTARTYVLTLPPPAHPTNWNLACHPVASRASLARFSSSMAEDQLYYSGLLGAIVLSSITAD